MANPHRIASPNPGLRVPRVGAPLSRHSKTRRKFGRFGGARVSDVSDPQQFRPHNGFRFYANVPALKRAAGRRPALRPRGATVINSLILRARGYIFRCEIGQKAFQFLFTLQTSRLLYINH